MPSIKDAVAKNQALQAAGAVSSPAPVPEPQVQSPPSLDLPTALPQRGMFPASLVLASDRSDSSREFRSAGARSATFPYPPTSLQTPPPTVVQQAVVSGGSAAVAISLQTNNIPNADQAVLNLVAGSGITLTPDTNGAVAIASTAGGDGLVHGDMIWAADSAYVSYRDDFKLGGATVSVTGGASTFGDLGWDGVTGTGAVWSKNAAYNALPHTGWVTSFSGGTASTYSSIFFPFAATSGSQYNAPMPLLDYPGWKMVWVFGFFSQRTDATASSFPLTKKQLYIGLSPCMAAATWNPGSTVNGRPPYFIGLRFDTDTTSPAISDSTFQFEIVANPNFSQTRINTQGTVSNTGITPTEFISYRFEMTYTSSTSLTMSLYGSDGSSATHTFTSVPTVSSVSGVSGLALNASRNNGLGRLTYATNATAGTSNYCWAMGSKVTITNSSFTPVNGTWTLIGDAVGDLVFVLAGGSSSTPSCGATITGYPGLTPYFAWGNDTQATPTTAAIGIDFFSLVWNSGLAASPLAVVNTATRWTTGS